MSHTTWRNLHQNTIRRRTLRDKMIKVMKKCRPDMPHYVAPPSVVVAFNEELSLWHEIVRNTAREFNFNEEKFFDECCRII